MNEIQINQVVEFILNHPHFVFDRQLQRGEEDTVSINEKKQQLISLLKRSPYIFVERYETLLDANLKDMFLELQDDDISLLLRGATVYDSSARNRRLAYLNTIDLERDEFFSTEAMRTRDPQQYDDIVGKDVNSHRYHANNEDNEDENQNDEDAVVSAFRRIHRDYTSSSNPPPKTFHRDLPYFNEKAFEKDLDSLLEQSNNIKEQLKTAVEHVPTSTSSDNLEQQQLKRRKPTLKSDKNNDDMDDYDDDDDDGDEGLSNVNNNTMPPNVTPAEHAQNIALFRKEMIERWLSGDELDFDYSLVDNNRKFDDLNALERDAQDKYFDSD